MTESPLYFRQLLSGRDFAKNDPIAKQMVNFAYLIGDRTTKRCVIVDAAYNASELMGIAQEDGMEVEGVLATHHHPDHVGGEMFGHSIPGVRELLEEKPIKIHCNKEEAEWIRRTADVSESDLAKHDPGDVLELGAVSITLIHTPGHTPGSQCFLVEDKLIAGDTLFLEGCGRTDFPGGDAEEIYRSIHTRLAKIPDDTILYPGHLYDPRSHAPLGDVRETNGVFQIPDVQSWLRYMGGA